MSIPVPYTCVGIKSTTMNVYMLRKTYHSICAELGTIVVLRTPALVLRV